MINDVYAAIKSNDKVSKLFRTCPLEILDGIEVKNFDGLGMTRAGHRSGS